MRNLEQIKELGESLRGTHEVSLRKLEDSFERGTAEVSSMELGA